MSAAYRPAAHVDGGGGHQVGVQQMEGIAHANHVGHRVKRSHLVEMDIPHRAPVGLGLRLSDGVVDLTGAVPHLLGQG